MSLWNGGPPDDYKNADIIPLIINYNNAMNAVYARKDEAKAQNKDAKTIAELQKEDDRLEEECMDEVVKWCIANVRMAPPEELIFDPTLLSNTYELLQKRYLESEDPEHRKIAQHIRGQKAEDAAKKAKEKTTNTDKITEQTNPGTP